MGTHFVQVITGVDTAGTSEDQSLMQRDRLKQSNTKVEKVPKRGDEKKLGEVEGDQVVRKGQGGRHKRNTRSRSVNTNDSAK